MIGRSLLDVSDLLTAWFNESSIECDPDFTSRGVTKPKFLDIRF
jgi:hypothetical protein